MNDFNFGMILEGVVINVINFGVFVDIGVYQDGLVYILVLLKNFIVDLWEVVKVGDIVFVKVVEIDLFCKCIVFSMCLDEVVGEKIDGQRFFKFRKVGYKGKKGGVVVVKIKSKEKVLLDGKIGIFVDLFVSVKKLCN